MSKKILVTGGAGYIGSHTILEILENTNWDLVSIDNFINSSPKSFDRIKSISGKSIENHNIDLRNFEALKSFFEKTGRIDGIIHFAALKAVGESVEKPLWYYDNNFNGLVNVLACCKRFNVENLIFSSSCSIYGNVEHLPVDEDTPLAKSESPYAHTKAVGEEILEHHCRASSTKVISLRYFNPVGAHASGLIGEDPINKPNNLLPIVALNASGAIPEMSVHGGDYPTRDGTCIRDYIHVSDIAKAHVKALGYQLEDKNNEQLEYFNLGSGDGVSVLEVLTAFEKYNGIKLKYKMGPRREGDVVSIYSNSSKAKNLLGWETEKGLEEMVTSQWKWQQTLNEEKHAKN